MAFNYTLTFDQLNQIEQPSVILCSRDQHKYGEIFPVTDLRITLNLNAPHEISFSTPHFYHGKKNHLWDKIKDLRCVFIEKFGYFELYISQSSSTDEVKAVTGKSIEVELGQIFLRDFQINDIDDDSYEDYTEIISFYNPLEPSRSLLHKTLEKAPAWTIGHVDRLLWTMQRQFSVDNVSIYDFLTGEVAEQFHCIVLFDCFNRTVNVYDLDTYGEQTAIYIDRENFAHEITLEAEAGEIKNCFKVIGGEGIDIREVNPNGTDYIWSLSSLNREDMSSELLSRLDDYDNAYSSKTKEYEAVMAEIHDTLSVIAKLYQQKPVSEEESTDLTKCGLTELNQRLSAKQNVEDVYKTAGYGDPDSDSYETVYLPNHEAILELEAEIAVRKAQIQAAGSEYQTAVEKRKAIQDYLDLEKWLGKELWLELSLYRREDTYENTTYEEEENTTQLERFEMERDLMEEAAAKLRDISNPLYKATAKLDNLLADRELQQHHIGDFTIGNFIQLGNEEDEIMRIRVISISIDFHSLHDITVDFSEMKNISGILSDAQSVLDQAATAATSYSAVMRQYDKNKDNLTFVQNVLKDGLDASLVSIANSSDQELTLSGRGLLGRKWNPEKSAYEDEQIHVINNSIVMTDDAWKSCRLALGKIFYNGTYSYGLLADLLVGSLVISEKMHIENESGSFLVDENGARITDLDLTVANDTNTLKISPAQNEIFSIYKGEDRQVYIDTAGNAHFAGDITGSTGTFSGSINVNDLFTVDSHGTVYAQSGLFRGEVEADSGYIGQVSITQWGLNGGFIQAETFYSSNTSYNGTYWGSNYTSISGGNIHVSGSGNYIKNEGSFPYDDSSEAYGSATIKNGTVLIYGPNAYVRGRTYGAGGYHKLIGISSGGNLIIGDPPGSSGYQGSEEPTSMGVPGKLPVLIYGSSLKFNDQDILGSSSGSGIRAGWSSSTILNWVENASGNGAYYRFTNTPASGNLITDIATTNYVQQYTSKHAITSNNISNYLSGYAAPSLYGLGFNIDGSECYPIANAPSAFASAKYVRNKIDASDQRLKESITDLYRLDQIVSKYMSLRPVSYKFKHGISEYTGKEKLGFIAQEVKSIFSTEEYDIAKLQNAEADYKKFTGETAYGLDYNSFHALHVFMNQKHETEIAQLKTETLTLNNHILMLENRLLKLEELINA